MAAFLERAVHSGYRMFSLLCLFVALAVSHFGFEGSTLFLIASNLLLFKFFISHNRHEFCSLTPSAVLSFLTHSRLASFLYDIGKQNSSRYVTPQNAYKFR